VGDDRCAAGSDWYASSGHQRPYVNVPASRPESNEHEGVGLRRPDWGAMAERTGRPTAAVERRGRALGGGAAALPYARPYGQESP